MPDPDRSDLASATSARWFGPPDRPLLGWVSRPGSTTATTGIVVVPPVGYEYWSAHRTLRTLAEGLATRGATVVRFDLDGTGDSAGDQWDPDRLEAWRAGIRAVCDELRSAGMRRVGLVGLRLGASLSLLEGAACQADLVVAWAPVSNGRRYVRELRMLGVEVPAEAGPGRVGGVVVTGTVFSPQTLDALAGINLEQLTTRPAPAILVVDRDDRPPSTALVDHLSHLGAETHHGVVAGTAQALDRPSEYATVPAAALEVIGSWVGDRLEPEATPTAPAARTWLEDAGPARAVVCWGEEEITEEVVAVGPHRLVGVLGRSMRPTSRPLVVWLNSGSEVHVGPGRAWVEYSRELNRAGYPTLRLDFSGWGESPDLGHAPGRPYDQHTVAEAGEVLAALGHAGYDRVVLAGLCAGAWVALRVAADIRPPGPAAVALAGVVAINPQLYWQPGDPVEADIANETHVRRQAEMASHARGARLGLWSALDVLGVRHPASRWLRQLDRSRRPVLALFAAGDDGSVFLRDRVGRAWSRSRRAGRIQLLELEGIDHPMHRQWLRPMVLEALRGFLDQL